MMTHLIILIIIRSISYKTFVLFSFLLILMLLEAIFNGKPMSFCFFQFFLYLLSPINIILSGQIRLKS